MGPANVCVGALVRVDRRALRDRVDVSRQLAARASLLIFSICLNLCFCCSATDHIAMACPPTHTLASLIASFPQLHRRAFVPPSLIDRPSASGRATPIPTQRSPRRNEREAGPVQVARRIGPRVRTTAQGGAESRQVQARSAPAHQAIPHRRGGWGRRRPYSPSA